MIKAIKDGVVPGAGIEPARLAAGDFESPDMAVYLYSPVLIQSTQINLHPLIHAGSRRFVC